MPDINNDEYDRVWRLETLSEDEQRHLHTDLFKDDYYIGWVDKNVTYRERRAARQRLAQTFDHFDMSFAEVFDYEQWMIDNGYAEVT